MAGQASKAFWGSTKKCEVNAETASAGQERRRLWGGGRGHVFDLLGEDVSKNPDTACDPNPPTPKNLRNTDRKEGRKRRGDRTFEQLSLNLIMLVQQCRTATHKWRSLHRERSH